MNIAVILAGGIGNRFGASIPKQFVEVLGKPILAYTIDAFEQHKEIDAILVVCVKSYIGYMFEIKDRYGFNKLKWVTEGGNTFQESVLKGISFLENKARQDDIVLIHFGASPFITSDIVSDAIRVCKNKGNAISTTDYYLLSGKKKINSSVSESDNYTEEYIDRETIAVMNSPHAFKYGFVSNMYKEAIKTGIINSVEPHTTTLMYAMGKKIYFSLGNQNNVKITCKEDLELFEGYLLAKQRNSLEMVTGEVIVFLADGFEECEGLLVVDILRRAGLRVLMASVMDRRDVKSSRDILIHSDCLAENVDYDNAKLLVLPGGRLGTKNLSNNDFVLEKIRQFADDRYLAAMCAAPSILASLGLLEGMKATVHPDFDKYMGGAHVTEESVTVDENIITCQGLGASIPFALKIVEILKGKEDFKQIADSICYKI